MSTVPIYLDVPVWLIRALTCAIVVSLAMWVARPSRPGVSWEWQVGRVMGFLIVVVGSVALVLM